MAEEQPVFTQAPGQAGAPGAPAVPNRAPVFEAMGRLGQGLAALGEALYVGEQQERVLKAKLTLAKGFQELEQQAAQESDWSKVEQVFATGSDAIKQQVDALGMDGRTQQAIEAAYADRHLLASANVANLVQQKRAAGYVADRDELYETIVRAAAQDPERGVYGQRVNSAQREQVLDQVQADVESGYISEDQARKKGMAMLERLDQNSALDLLNRNPLAAMRALSDKEAFPMLDPARREQLLAQAITDAGQAERRASSAVRQQQDEAAGEMWTMHAQGTLTAQMVMDRREDLSLDEYKQLLGAVSGGGAKQDDPATYNRLLTDIYNGRDSRSAILEANKGGLLANSTAKTLLDENQQQQAGGQGGPVSPFKSTRNYLRESLGVTGLMGKLDFNSERRLAQATWEFDAWGRENPDASERDLRSKADALIRRYSKIDFTQQTDARPLPYGPPLARNAYTAEDLMQRAKQLEVDRQGMSADQYDREKRNLVVWLEAVQERVRKQANTEEGDGESRRR